RGAVLGRPVLEGVPCQIDGAPGRGKRLVLGWRADEPAAVLIAGAEVLVVPLGLDQGDLVCPACHGGPAELDPVVLPEADGADLVRAGHRAQYAMPAVRAGVGVAHLRSLVAGAPVCHGFLCLRPP